MVLEESFDIGTLEELRRQLDSSAGRRLRKALLREFWKVCRYSNAEEWNRAVRPCEALVIMGWGDCEPVVAYCGGDGMAWGDQNEASGSTFKGWRGSHLGGLDDPAGYPAFLHPSLILLRTSVGWLVALDRTFGERQHLALGVLISSLLITTESESSRAGVDLPSAARLGPFEGRTRMTSDPSRRTPSECRPKSIAERLRSKKLAKFKVRNSGIGTLHA